MPQFSFLFEEASPLITYTGFWTEGNAANDTFAMDYEGSFRVTNSSNAKATLGFTGTGVSLFGALRPNHGDYSVVLDNGGAVVSSGTSPNLFKHTLFQKNNLTYAQHTLLVTNEPTGPAHPYFDLDFVQIERVIGQDNDTMFLSTLDDNSPFVKYTGAWISSSGFTSSNSGGTLHQTTQSNSQLEITFQGCCIELYGLYANAVYTVSIDGGPAVQMQGLDINLDQTMWHPGTLLYLMDGLSVDVNHTVSLTTSLANVLRPFSFEKSIIRSTKDFASSAIPFPPPASSAALNQNVMPKSTPLGAIIGASLGGVVLLSLLVVAWIFWRKRRKNHDSEAPRIEPMTEVRSDNVDTTQTRVGWVSRLRSRALGPQRPSEAAVTAWYPPSNSTPISNLPGSHGQNVSGVDSSGTIISGSHSDPIPDVRRRSAKIRPETFARPPSVPVPPGSDASSAPAVQSVPSAATTAGSSQSSLLPSHLSHGSDHRHTMVASPNSNSIISPIREEDGGLLYREEGTLPPAYNPGWEQRQ